MNKRKRAFIFIIILLLVVSGCSSPNEAEDEENSSTLEATSIIVPSLKLNEEYYRGVVPYKSSPINGMLREIPTRLDNKYFEMGLIELAKNNYSPSNYIFQEGQILTMNEIEPLLDPNQYPQYENFVYTVTEHNYLFEDGQYGGVVIGLLVSPRYYLKNENGEYIRNSNGARVVEYYTEEEMNEKSKQLANDVVSLVRKKDPNVSITVGVMKAQTRDLKLPGTFFLTGKTGEKDKDSLEWKGINETYLFLPTDLRIEDENADTIKIFNYFKGEMEEYLPGYAGITGMARVVNGNLIEITIKSLAEFDSTSEAIQYTQFAASRIKKYFPEETHVNFYVNTIDRPRALYVRDSDGKDYMHIYRD